MSFAVAKRTQAVNENEPAISGPANRKKGRSAIRVLMRCCYRDEVQPSYHKSPESRAGLIRSDGFLGLPVALS